MIVGTSTTRPWWKLEQQMNETVAAKNWLPQVKKLGFPIPATVRLHRHLQIGYRGE
ncbi:hypothetical protein RKK42_00010 [Klebsiella pneumoniae]|nr:hypothetical protein [Klebsiella pneumoniae]